MNKSEQLIELKKRALEDNLLPLRKGATNLVFGVGSPDAQILCIGEGPGYWEDQKGEPFVGNAGKLLDRLLFSIGIKREDVYITNVVMHRPPENRDPESFEIEAYEPYVDGIIEIIKPKVVITLGRFSMAKFLPGVTISSVHGKTKEIDFGGGKIMVIPMYHPAAALRNGEIMRRIKDDFLLVPKILKEIETRKDVSISKEEKNEGAAQMELL